MSEICICISLKYSNTFYYIITYAHMYYYDHTMYANLLVNIFSNIQKLFYKTCIENGYDIGFHFQTIKFVKNNITMELLQYR